MNQSRFPIVRLLSIAAGMTGLIVVTSLPLRAQTTPQTAPTQTTPNASPSPAPIAPNQTAPSQTTPNQTTPTQTAPAQTAPSQTTPSNTAPTAPAAPLGSTGNQPLSNLLQQVSQTGSFTTLAQAVQAAGLDTALQNQGGRYTIFAPTDEAFAALPAGTLEQLLQPENRALLRQLLSYHVVPGEVRSNQLRTGVVDTLGGGIAVRVTPERVIVNDGSVVRADIPAANGVVHVVNRVLIPQELRQQLTNLQSSR